MFDGAQAADYDGDFRVGDLEAWRPGGPWMALEGRVSKRDVGGKSEFESTDVGNALIDVGVWIPLEWRYRLQYS